jgi:hypothetical protein
MAYIGNTPEVQNFVAGADKFSGDGTNTTFVLSRKIPTNFDVIPVVENVIQDPFIAYSLSANTTSGTTDIVFSSAPPSGTDNIVVNYRATQIVSLDNSINDSLFVNGNIQIQGTGRRIIGDFSNATVANRVAFQNSVTNGTSPIGILPNGTATSSSFNAFNNSDATNASIGRYGATSTDVRIESIFAGSGSYLPMTFHTGGLERVRINTIGKVGIGTSTPVSGVTTLTVAGDISMSGNSRAILGNIYFDNGWKYVIDGFGWGIVEGNGNLQFYNAVNNTSGAGATANIVERMRIDSAGNVGIGTDSPIRRLDVNNAIFARPVTTAQSSEIKSVASNFSSLPSFTNTGVKQFGSTATGTTLGLSNASLGLLEFINCSAGAIYTNGGSPIVFGTSSIERMRITSAGNVFIGTTSNGGGQLGVAADSETVRFTPTSGVASTSPTFGTFRNGGGILYVGLDSESGGSFGTGGYGGVFWHSGARPIVFATNNTVRMQVDASGRLLVGTSTARGGITVDTTVSHTTGTTFAGAGGNGGWITGFTSQALTTGIQTPGVVQAAGVYTVSDVRLKENVIPITSALGFIADITPVEFDWKSDKTKDTGYIAQDLLARGYGHLVSAIPDAPMEEMVHEDGNVSPAGMRFVARYDSVVPILHRAIQEQQAIIEQLKTRIENLESQ